MRMILMRTHLTGSVKSMDKISKITGFLLLSSVTERTNEVAQLVAPIAAKLLLNDVASLLREEETDIADLEEYHHGMTQLIADCALLQAYGFIESRHTRQIIRDCWNYPYVGVDLVQYAHASKIFDEATGDATLIAVQAVLADINYAKAVEQVKGGRDKAIGALVGAVMKKVKGDPKQIKEMLAAEMGVTLPA
jgi:Asp-tRNA(Asn)/Glu-tRNA(Gln) amidotransferase B subunit